MDFNVSPMTAVIAQRAGDQYQFFDEIVLNNSNTPEMTGLLNFDPIQPPVTISILALQFYNQIP